MNKGPLWVFIIPYFLELHKKVLHLGKTIHMSPINRNSIIVPTSYLIKCFQVDANALENSALDSAKEEYVLDEKKQIENIAEKDNDVENKITDGGDCNLSSGLALEDLRLHHYEKKLPQEDDLPNCDNTDSELDNRIRLVAVTSGSLDEKPYTQLGTPTAMTARRNSLNLSSTKNSHVS